MGIKFFLLCFLLFFGACDAKIHNTSLLNGKTYESNRGPLFGGNMFIFNSDNSFTYIGQGPVIFISRGTWDYYTDVKAIVLQSENPDVKYIKPKKMDTLWVDLSQKQIKVVSKRKIKFNGIEYYSK